MNIGCEEKSRKILKGYEPGSIKERATRTQLPLDAISFYSGGVQPEPKGILRFLNVLRVGLNKCVLVVRYTPITGVTDDPRPAPPPIRQQKREKPRPKCDRRRIALEPYPLLCNSTLCEP